MVHPSLSQLTKYDVDRRPCTRCGAGLGVARKPLYTRRSDDPEYVSGDPQPFSDSFFQTHTSKLYIIISDPRYWRSSSPKNPKSGLEYLWKL